MARLVRIRCVACGCLPHLHMIDGPLAAPEILLQTFGGSEPLIPRGERQRGISSPRRGRANIRGLVSYQPIEDDPDEADLYRHLADRYEAAARFLRHHARRLTAA